VYALVMRALYGRYYALRDRAVAAHVPDGASVLELCCGPARLYERELRGRVGRYVAFDASPRFVARGRRHGIDIRAADVATAPLERADVVLMQASLYHFLPDARGMLERMRAAADERVIVCEPIRNLADSRLAPLARLSARATATADGAQAHRFTAASLASLMASLGAGAVRAQEPVAGGREALYVLEPARAAPLERR
jgi:SAM-dependent methyltransferase